jgi:hypothetical protein
MEVVDIMDIVADIKSVDDRLLCDNGIKRLGGDFRIFPSRSRNV